MNAQHTIIFSDAHRFGKSQMITVHLAKCESSEVQVFFLLAKVHIDWSTNYIQTTDQIFREPMKAMRAAINLWNQTVMDNPVTDEASEEEAGSPVVADEEDEFPW